jgi:hypothetical protein
MTDYPIYCPAQTYRDTRDSPAEFCENEVDNEGDLCSDHDAEDRADDDYDRYLDAKAEREADPDYYTDYSPWGDE